MRIWLRNSGREWVRTGKRRKLEPKTCSDCMDVFDDAS